VTTPPNRQPAVESSLVRARTRVATDVPTDVERAGLDAVARAVEAEQAAAGANARDAAVRAFTDEIDRGGSVDRAAAKAKLSMLDEDIRGWQRSSMRWRKSVAPVGKAMAALRELLANGPRPTTDIQREVHERTGASQRTIERARSLLGVIARQERAPGGRTARWVLALPKERAVDV
jgi:hypothetical protein